MSYPKLVRNPRTSVRVIIEAEDSNEFNERVVLLDDELKCNYQDTGSIKFDSKKSKPEITGSLYFDGDILPGTPVISTGTAIIFGEPRHIVAGTKARNPDGSVNYTKLDVI